MPSHALRNVGPVFGGRFESLAIRAANVLLTWQERAAQRHALATLDARMLRDIGLSRADVQREAAKPFWRA
jgi:uncharacterized protein YjiS (DUF1127 family)